jgi:hypothetical protein
VKHELRPDGLLARHNRDGTTDLLARCPRCRRWIARREEHEHCNLAWCTTVGEHVHCLVPECRMTGTRHQIDHMIGRLRLPDFTERRMDELVRLTDSRPMLVADAIIEALEKQGRTVAFATRLGTCAACQNEIVPGVLIESVQVLRNGPHLWIHVFCLAPASRRAESRSGFASDQTGAGRVFTWSELPVEDEGRPGMSPDDTDRSESEDRDEPSVG